MAQDNHHLDDYRDDDMQVQQLIEEVVGMLELSPDFESAWEAANRVCDRYGLGRAAA